jgi:hypothetical protein
MKIKGQIILSIALGLNIGPALAEGIMIPGGWETTMTNIAENPITGEKKNIGKSKTSSCLSKKFLASDPYLKATINKERLKSTGAECSVEDYERKGEEAHWTMKCITNDGRSLTTKFIVTLSAKQALVTMNQVVKKDDQLIHINSSAKHTYIGECTDDMPRL